MIFDGDLNDIKHARKFVRECDRIYHLAGKNREDEGAILKNNIVSTANLVLATILEEVDPEIIFASSKQVEWNGRSEYGFTKLAEEEIIKKAGKWCIFRIPNVYGPGCRPFYNSVIATFCYQIAKGEPVTIKDPSIAREFIFIDDLIESLLEPELGSYNHPRGQVMTLGEIYSLLTDRIGSHRNLERCLSYFKEGVEIDA